MLKEEIIRTTESIEPKRYKYLLNGETFYFTREELKDYMERLYIKNKIPYDNQFLEAVVDSRIKKILKYDGDPYGGMISQEGKKEAHEMEANGYIFHINCFY
jgi:predicted RNA-binding protein with PUA domain